MLRAPTPWYGPGFWIASIERRQLDHAFQKNGVLRSEHLRKPQPLTHRYWSLELRTSLTEAEPPRGLPPRTLPAVVYVLVLTTIQRIRGTRPDDDPPTCRHPVATRWQRRVRWRKP